MDLQRYNLLQMQFSTCLPPLMELLQLLLENIQVIIILARMHILTHTIVCI